MFASLILTPTALSQSLTTLAVNSDPYLTGSIQGLPDPQTALPTAPAHPGDSSALGHQWNNIPGCTHPNGQQPESPPLLGTLMHEGIAPDMVPMSRSQAHAGPVMEPQSPSFRLSGRDLQPFLSPKPFHSLWGSPSTPLRRRIAVILR